MAKYWDWSDSTASNWTSSSSTLDWTIISSAATYWTWPVRRLLVPKPECWSDEDNLDFVELINRKTRTGWIVEMVIKGDILICDPNIEQRTMEDFIPLLKWYASPEDLIMIEAFFEDHPIHEAKEE